MADFTNSTASGQEKIESILDQITVTEGALCMACQGSGTSRVLPTTIPYFGEVAVCYFKCDDCGFRNNETMDTSRIQEKGLLTTFVVTKAEDLNLQVLKSNTASVRLPELEFEIPHSTQKGVLSTIEGILSTAKDALLEHQDARREADPTLATKLDSFIAELTLCVAGLKFPFTFVLDDPSGNSHIQNPAAPREYEHRTLKYYVRSAEQNCLVGLGVENDRKDTGSSSSLAQSVNPDMGEDSTNSTVKFDVRSQSKQRKGWLKFIDYDKYVDEKNFNFLPIPCQNCQKEGLMKTCQTNIPFFKEVVIMAFSCDHCGWRSNEIKAGGAVPSKGKIFTLSVSGTKPEDVHRDILKSNTADVTIPEIDFYMAAGSLGGVYTTVEGLLQQMREKLISANPFARGDSADADDREKFSVFLEKMELYEQGETPFTLILKDPMANSFIYSPRMDGYEDAELVEEEYVRSKDEDEELGLLDMNTEGDYWTRDKNSADQRRGADAESV